MSVLIAFLRAVNVGGASSIKMEALRGLCPALGLRHAATLLQSGNLVAAYDGGEIAELAQRLEAAIASIHPYKPRVIGRSAAELRGMVENNPLPLGDARQPNRLLVMPLEREPEEGALARLRERHPGPEEIALVGRDLYVHYVNGVGTSKLTNALIERQLGVQGTARNWNTIMKLVDLAGEVEARG